MRQKRDELIGKGVEVTEVVDHTWAKSIYFKDPNGLMLEFCCLTREFGADDAVMQPRFELSNPQRSLNLAPDSPMRTGHPGNRV